MYIDTSIVPGKTKANNMRSGCKCKQAKTTGVFKGVVKKNCINLVCLGSDSSSGVFCLQSRLEFKILHWTPPGGLVEIHGKTCNMADFSTKE